MLQGTKITIEELVINIQVEFFSVFSHMMH